MATKVHMEALSPTMEEGRLVKWAKHEGDPVKSGDTLAEVETDKAVMELVARADGQLLKVMVPEGTTVPVGNVVAWIGKPGEKVDGAGSRERPRHLSPHRLLQLRLRTQPQLQRSGPLHRPHRPQCRLMRLASRRRHWRNGLRRKRVSISSLSKALVRAAG